MRDRLKGRAIAGIVLVSDGGDTSDAAEQAAPEGPHLPRGGWQPDRRPGPGSPQRHSGGSSAGRFAGELAASAVGHGHGTAPIVMRLMENGRPIDVRQATPAAEGVPVRATFRVTPARGAPTIYTIEIPSAAGELVPENNARSVLVQPPSRSSRVLLVEGAPGFEHSFLKRALAADTGLEIDSVVRKGRTSKVLTPITCRRRGPAAPRSPPAIRKKQGSLPIRRARARQRRGNAARACAARATRDFVGRRGGGLLVLGAHSFLRRGLIDTALEEVLPLELAGRGRGVVPAVGAKGMNRVALTPAGEMHPVMQLGAATDDTRKRWDATPALASSYRWAIRARAPACSR